MMLDRILRDKLNLLPSTAHPSLLPPTPSLLAPCRLPSNAIIPLSRTPIREGPVRIKCSSGWGKGIAECYARLPSTTILQLELRKERAGPFHHEFVVAYEQSGHIYRFDRRPDPAVPVDTIRRSGCAAFDTVEEAQLTLLDETSDCVLTLEFLKALDFTFIFQVCVGLQRDDAAERYTLQRYNCYFFSWTIILIAMRHAGSWERRLDLHWYMLSRDWEFGGDMRMSEGLWSEVGVVDVEAAVGEAAAEAMKSAVWNPYFVKFFDLLADTRQVNLRPILCQAASDDCLDAHWRKPLVMNVLKSLREILPPLIRFTLVRLMQNTLWWSSLVSSLQSIEDEDVTIAIVQEMLRDKFRETLPSVIVEAMLGSTVPTLADILSKTICQALLKPLSRNLANTVSRTLIDLLPDTIKVSLHKAKTKYKGSATLTMHSQLQDFIEDRLKAHSDRVAAFGLGSEVHVDMQQAMHRVWVRTRPYLALRGAWIRTETANTYASLGTGITSGGDRKREGPKQGGTSIYKHP